MKEIITIKDDLSNIDDLRQTAKKYDFEVHQDLTQSIQEYLDNNRSIISVSAIQLGDNVALFAIREPYTNHVEFYANPKIKHVSMDKFVYCNETCASLPEEKALTKRYAAIKVKYQSLDGLIKSKFLKGIISVAFQHEMDHLRGNLITDIDLKYND